MNSMEFSTLEKALIIAQNKSVTWNRAERGLHNTLRQRLFLRSLKKTYLAELDKPKPKPVPTPIKTEEDLYSYYPPQKCTRFYTFRYENGILTQVS